MGKMALIYYDFLLYLSMYKIPFFTWIFFKISMQLIISKSFLLLKNTFKGYLLIKSLKKILCLIVDSARLERITYLNVITVLHNTLSFSNIHVYVTNGNNYKLFKCRLNAWETRCRNVLRMSIIYAHSLSLREYTVSVHFKFVQ